MATRDDEFDRFLECVKQRSRGRHAATMARRELLLHYWAWTWGTKADCRDAEVIERSTALQHLLEAYCRTVDAMKHESLRTRGRDLPKVAETLLTVLREAMLVLSRPASKDTDDGETVNRALACIFDRNDNARWQAFVFVMSGEFVASIADEKHELLKIEAECRETWFS